jgi:hypothetical protein
MNLTLLKVHKHEIFLNFFLAQIKSLYALRKFSKKISLSFLRFSPEFRSSNIYAVTEHTRNQIFFERYPKFFFFKIFTVVLLDVFLDGFSKFRFFIVKICILIRGFWVIFENYLCACWAYVETILSHAEHTRNRFHRTLSIRGTNFRACSAGGKMWTVLHVQSMLSIRGTIFIAHWAYAERISVLWFLLDLKHSYNIAKYIYHIIRSFFCLFYRWVYIA